jgi:hypothetical protein
VIALVVAAALAAQPAAADTSGMADTRGMAAVTDTTGMTAAVATAGMTAAVAGGIIPVWARAEAHRRVLARAEPRAEPGARRADAWLGSDKAQHVLLSYATTVFTFAAVRAVSGDADAALYVALPVAAAAGVGKEVHDLRRGGRFSVRDLVADALGIAGAYFFLREVR